jgi:hypothetical protein
MRFMPFLAAGAIVLSTSLAAHADTTYTYVGQPFSTAFAPFTLQDSVTGSFATSAPLADNLSDVRINPTSFSFSDGLDVLTQSSAGVSSFVISTDSNGAIINWGILVVSTDSKIQIETTGGPEFPDEDGDLGFGSRNFGGNNVSGTFTSPTAAQTPEPSSMIMLGTGLMGIAGTLRRRFRA